MYETGIALNNAGVIPGADMTPECALTKLSYLLAKYSDTETIRMLAQRNLRGELTIVEKRPRFTYGPHPSDVFSKKSMTSSLINLLGLQKEYTDTNLLKLDNLNSSNKEQDSEFEEEGEPQDRLENQLVPIALCHAARTQDIETLQLILRDFEHLVNASTPDHTVITY